MPFFCLQAFDFFVTRFEPNNYHLIKVNNYQSFCCLQPACHWVPVLRPRHPPGPGPHTEHSPPWWTPGHGSSVPVAAHPGRDPADTGRQSVLHQHCLELLQILDDRCRRWVQKQKQFQQCKVYFVGESLRNVEKFVSDLFLVIHSCAGAWKPGCRRRPELTGKYFSYGHEWLRPSRLCDSHVWSSLCQETNVPGTSATVCCCCQLAGWSIDRWSCCSRGGCGPCHWNSSFNISIGHCRCWSQVVDQAPGKSACCGGACGSAPARQERWG